MLPVLTGIVKLHVSAVLVEIPPAVEVNLRARQSVAMLIVSGTALARPPSGSGGLEPRDVAASESRLMGILWTAAARLALEGAGRVGRRAAALIAA